MKTKMTSLQENSTFPKMLATFPCHQLFFFLIKNRYKIDIKNIVTNVLTDFMLRNEIFNKK